MFASHRAAGQDVALAGDRVDLVAIAQEETAQLFGLVSIGIEHPVACCALVRIEIIFPGQIDRGVHLGIRLGPPVSVEMSCPSPATVCATLIVPSLVAYMIE